MSKRNDAATEAWSLVLELAFSHRDRFMAAVHELGLAPMQAHALRLLDRPVNMGDLADLLQCDASNVTGIVDRLEQRGLVERVAEPGDRRVKKLQLTAAGEDARERFLERMHVPPPTVASLSPTEAATLRDLLRRALGRA
jgi:MarR family transcriptional regulator, organic hydroperoxide resistance regulator